MIHNVQETGRKLRVRPTERLRVHFLALARRIVSWHKSDDCSVDSGVVIGVTSADRKVGRTIVSFNLASALATVGTGPVLFVETQHSPAGFSRKVPRPGHGLREVLQGDENPSGCICHTNVNNLFVMSCGRVRDKDAIELPVEALESINAELGSTFEYIIYDLPAADDTNLSFPMIQHMDGVLIVNESNIQEGKILRVVRRIRDLNTKVIGLVLNKA